MKEIMRLSLPLTLWLIGFSALYGLQAVICAQGWQDLLGPGGMVWGRWALMAGAAGVVLIQGAALLFLIATKPAPGLMRTASLGLAVVALVATVWTLLPLTLPLCQ